MRRSPYRAKRMLDVIGASVGLLMLLPLLPLVAIAIKLGSPGPVFFRQPRVGIDRRADSSEGPDPRRRHDLGGAVFAMIKFRTMRADAEKMGGPSWTADNDPRITRVGAILRQTKIDELPQLWNVLRGEMSLVGPRPETPHFVAKLTNQLPVYRERVAGVKPGISGMAQIHCEDDGSFFASLREKVFYDLRYGAELRAMEHWHEPLRLDIGVILQTLVRLFNLRQKIDKEVIRIELPRQFEHVDLVPGDLARGVPHGVRAKILDDNPDKITVWWYLPRTRSEEPPDRDFLGVHLMKRLSDELSYERNRDGKGVNQLKLVKLLDGVARDGATTGDATTGDAATGDPTRGDTTIGDTTSAYARRHGGEELPGAESNPQLAYCGCDVIKIEAPSKVQYIPKVEEFLAPIWERLKETSNDLHFAFNMSLLVLEGLTNVIKHAHRSCPERRIPLEIVIDRQQVEVHVLDYGSGFDLEQATAMPAEALLAAFMEPEETTDPAITSRQAG